MKRRVRASAPAKVILFGEHFVVFGKRALATAVNRRLVVEVSEKDGNGRSGKGGYHIKIENIPTFGLEVDLFRGEKGEKGEKGEEGEEGGRGEALPYKDYGEATKAIAYVKESIKYLEESYGINLEGGGVEIEIKSEIPLSAGLGSSAATCVATVAALKEFFGWGVGGGEGDLEADLEAVREDAHRVELAVQGAASPVDTAISTYGGSVLVEQGEVKRLRLAGLTGLNLLVGCVGCLPLSRGTSDFGLKTKKIVEQVKARKETFKRIFDSLLEASEETTAEAVAALRERNFVRLGALMNINHGLLDAIGVVPRRLSELAKVSQELGALGAKVTGAGGLDEMGGVGSVLVLPGAVGRGKIKTAMEIAGALVLDVKTGGEGLKIEEKFDYNS